MTELRRVASAELLKLKRTLALRLAFAAPLLIVLLQLGVYLARGEQFTHGSDNPIAGFVRGIVTLWTLLLLPFYATLAAALVASLDHQEHHWDQLFALPIHRWTIFAAKWIAVTSLVILSSATLPVYALLAAQVVKLRLHASAGNPFPLGLLLDNVARSCAAALLLISIQMWFSLRWRSFVLALAIGIAGIMSGIILISAPLPFLSLYPWTAPGAAASPTHPPLALAWGLFAGLALGVASCRQLAQRDG
jgi:ABC-2 type transport system permease protein